MAHQNPPTTPSPWVARFAPLIAPGARVLDFACGGGRHTRFLVGLGHPVTAIDLEIGELGTTASDNRVEAVGANLEDRANWPLVGRRFAGIVITNFLNRTTLDLLLTTLDDGGVLIWETFATGNEKFGRPAKPNFLLTPGELYRALADDLIVVAFEQGHVTRPREKVVQRICAVRRDNLLTPIPD